MDGSPTGEVQATQESPGPGSSGQAAFLALSAPTGFPEDAIRPSNSPALTAPISASMSAGSLSLEATAMPALPFSNSMGLVP